MSSYEALGHCQSERLPGLRARHTLHQKTRNGACMRLEGNIGTCGGLLICDTVSRAQTACRGYKCAFACTGILPRRTETAGTSPHVLWQGWSAADAGDSKTALDTVTDRHPW